MSTNPFAQGNTDSYEQKSLTAGTYGSTKRPALKIIRYLVAKDDGTLISRPDKNGAMQHKFLVTALSPSREAIELFASQKNGHTTPLDEPDYDGTAFLKLTLHENWLNAEAYALAFSSKETDLVEVFKSVGSVTDESISKARAYFTQLAMDKVLAANTPTDQMEEAVTKQYQSELTQVRIKIGGYMRLQDWLHQGDKTKRDIHMDVKGLVGTEFAAKVTVEPPYGASIDDSGILTRK